VSKEVEKNSKLSVIEKQKEKNQRKILLSHDK
jgi:hypothetical protein